MGDWNLLHELIKALISCVSGLLILAASWFVGQRLTYAWNVRQKRREFQLLALEQFYVAYGEFFAVWKLWNRLDLSEPLAQEKRWELHKRAAAAEAIVEGTIVKLSSELDLKPTQIETLARFRQAFQQLRQSIRKSSPLPWVGAKGPEYPTFKCLAVHVSHLIGSEWRHPPVSAPRASAQLLTLTSNDFEENWTKGTTLL